MPVILEQHAQGASYAMIWGSPLEDGSVEVTFVHGPFQHDALDKYAQSAWNYSLLPRRIDGIVATGQLRYFQQVEIIAKPNLGKNFELFESQYKYEKMRHCVERLPGFRWSPVCCASVLQLQ